MTDDSKNENLHCVDERDLEYINAEKKPERRAAMVCAVTTYRRRDRLDAGDPVPSLQLAQLRGGPDINLSAARDRPLVLIFGSYT